MNLYEFQGKQLFRQAGLPVPPSTVVSELSQAPFYEGGSVVKAQVLTGGRGKAGAIKKCGTREETVKAAEEILNMKVKGFPVFKLLVEEAVETSAEYYFSISIDRNTKLISMMFTDQGGMDIESLPADKIRTLRINPFVGLRDYMLKTLLGPFGLEKDGELTSIIRQAYQLFVAKKLQLLEINPLARKKDGGIVALDSKVIMDDAAIDPSIDLSDMGHGDMSEFEVTMRGYNATAVELDPKGDIIILGNGAGAAVSTTDSLIHRGGSVRALIDLGTMGINFPEAEREQGQIGIFQYIASQDIKVFFFNSYFQSFPWTYWAKILKKAYVDSGICKRLPIVLRMAGNGAEESRELLKDSGLYIAESFEESCELVIKLSKGEL